MSMANTKSTSTPREKTPITNPEINWSTSALRQSLYDQMSQAQQWKRWYENKIRENEENWRKAEEAKALLAPVLALFQDMNDKAAFYAYCPVVLLNELKKVKSVVDEMEAGNAPVD